jgi:hypothetical protein
MTFGFKRFETTRDVRVVIESQKAAGGVITGEDPNVASKHWRAEQRHDATKRRADPTPQDAEDT